MKQIPAVLVFVCAVCLMLWLPNALAAEPQKGGTLTYGSVTEVSSIDPHVYQGTTWKSINLSLYNSLLSVDEKGQPVAALAESWEVLDARTIVFKLRKGVKFHKGQDFTAADVKYSLERILNPETGATLRSNLKGVIVTVIDDYTVKVEKDVDDVTLLSVLAMGETAIISEEWMKSGPNLKIEANGTGPFVLKDHEPKVRLVVEMNPTYFEKGLPYLDKIVFRMIKDGGTRVNAIKTGAVDVIDTVPWKDINLLKAQKNLVVNVQDGEFMNLWLNATKKPLDDQKVRQAIAYAIDRQAISEAAFFGYGSPLYGPPTNESSWYYREDLADTFKRDLDKAKKLLKEAGYEKGFDLELLTYNGLQMYTVTAQIVQANLKEIGIKVNIKLAEWASVVENKNKASYDFLIYGVTIKSPDPDVYSFYFGPESTYWAKPIGFRDETIEKLLAEGRTTTSTEARQKIYYQLEKRLLELSPWVHINWRANCHAHTDKVMGYKHLGGFLAEAYPKLKYTWLAK
ncbi:MAG: ABC transporter substrate-binding protein [Desulfocapsaceae bacterium]|nr:ABC transporter substrate-binding protein [Desulfocapsaceae bacterium]